MPKLRKIIERQTVEQIVDHVLELSENTKFMVMAPWCGRKGEHQKNLDSMRKAGYARMYIDGEVRTLDLNEEISLDKKSTTYP